MRASPGNLNIAFHLLKRRVCVKQDAGICRFKKIPGHDTRDPAIPAIADILKQPGQGILALTDHDIIRIPGYLPRAGRGMRAADNGEAAGCCDLVPVRRFIDGIETVTGNVTRRAVGRLQEKPVTPACGREHCKRVPCCMDPSPVDLHCRR
jgi:hypothetical protein